MKRLWRLLGTMFMVACSLNLFIELLSRKSWISLGDYVVNSPWVFLLNSLLILSPFLIVFFLKRKVFAICIISMSYVAVGVINGVLLIFRTTPFTAADLHLVKYAVSMLTLYLNWWQIAIGAICLFAAGVLAVYLWKKAPIDMQPVNLVESVCVSAVSMTVIWGALNLSIMSGQVSLQFGNIGQAFETYGFAYCFSNSLFNTGIEKPETYDKEVVEELEEEKLIPENSYSIAECRTPNIIMVQLESFFDPMLWKGNSYETDPIPFFRFLMHHYPSGYLRVPSVGAGTANTEFECITGMNLDFFGPGEYPYKTVLQKTACESMAFNMKELGYKTHVIHNNEGTFYDRHKVFAQLGFDTFTPIEYMYDIKRNPTGWCKDSVLTGEIEKTLDSSVGQDFIYTISVQGHGKYPSFEYYCSQIREMDQFIRQLVIMLNRRKEPSVLVLYGDHLPGFHWNSDEMENHSLFQTEYVIWNNLNLPIVNRDVEAYQLTSHLLNLLDIHQGTMVRFHQRYLAQDESETETEEYLDAMKILEYDMLYGDREVYGGVSPYKSVKMEMGITPIIQRRTVRGENQIIVFGEHFNAYSKICVNGKPVDTPYYSEKRLIAPNVPKKEGEVITVQQVGRDRIALGTARKAPES